MRSLNAVPIPPLKPVGTAQREWLVTCLATCVLASLSEAVDGPVSWWPMLWIVLAMYVVGALAWWRTRWIDLVEPVLVVEWCGVVRRRVPMGPGSVVDIRSLGGIWLFVHAPGARRSRPCVPLTTDPSSGRDLAPADLRWLADVVERHRAQGATQAAEVLRAQATHVEAGGDPVETPLALVAAEHRAGLRRRGWRAR